MQKIKPMPKDKRHSHKGRKSFYKNVTVTHNKIIHRKNGEVLKYGSIMVTKYAFMINMGSIINCYDENGNYIRKFQTLSNGKPTKNYFGFKGTKITADEFFETQEKNRTMGVKKETSDVKDIIENAFKVMRKKEIFNDIKSNYAKGTVLWCTDVANKTSDKLNIAPEIIRETLINIYNE